MFLSVPALVSAQIEYLEVLINDSVQYDFESVGNAPQIDQAPSNGDYLLNGNLNSPLGTVGANELVYLPNTDYLGTDTIKILYYVDDPVTGPTANFVTLVINVVEAYLEAVVDYTTTLTNTEVIISVLDNDIASGDLTLSNIPLTNNGTAEVTNGEIVFTPSTDFRGIAYLTYTVCDEDNNLCEVANVVVFVEDNTSLNDSTTIVTLKDQGTRALFSTSEGIQELLAPANGSLDVMDGGVKYTPNADFVGMDTFSYAYNLSTTTSIATFIIDVLDAPTPNTIVVEDYDYAAKNDSTEFNVLDNDLNDDLSILTYTQGEEGGEVIHLGDGLFKYIAPAGFYGIDIFEYTATVPGTTLEETGLAYVEVSNQLPAIEQYLMFTAINTPIVIDYKIPISNFDFEIITQSDNGELVYYPGETTIIVNGQDVSGYNLLVYYPDTDFDGADAFTIEYCVDTDCKTVDVDVQVKPVSNPQADTLCVTDCVWPGDTNADGSINVADVLPLGFCIGEVGEERVNGSAELFGQFADDWNETMGNTDIDIKHVDANGDGYISHQDTSVIYQSYGKYSNKITPIAAPSLTQIPLFFVPQNPSAGPGDLVIIDIVLGTENIPARDIHGITFGLNFNQDIVEPGTMDVNYSSDNWLAYESTMMSLMKEPQLGRVESGYTRSNGVSKHGYGIIGQVSFIVVEDLVDGIRLRDTLSVPVFPESVLSMNATGQYMELISQPFNLNFAHVIDERFDEDNQNLIAYPNPTNGFLNIHVNGNNELEQVIVHSITGQEVYRTSDDLSGKQTSIQFDERAQAGVYLVTAICDKGVYTSKVELFR